MADQVFYQTLLENMTDGVYFVDKDRRITYWNKGAERITGYSKEMVTGSSCADNILRHVNRRGEEMCISGCPLHETLKDGRIREADVFLHHADGHRLPVFVRISPIRGKDGEITGAVEVFSGGFKALCISEQVEQLRKEAMIDSLTDVGNRRFADMNLDNLINGWNRHQRDFGLLMVDIDHFKRINDTHGHIVGDKVLKMVAKTLSHGLRSLDMVCRWGGEEFLVLLPNIRRPALARVAEKLRMLVEKSELRHQKKAVRVTVCVGGAVVRMNDTVETIVNRADERLYTCKNHGRNRVEAEGESSECSLDDPESRP